MKRFLFILVITVAATAGLFAHTTYAVDETGSGTGQALEIAPPLISLKTDAGKTLNTSIKIRDIAKTSLVVTGEVNDFSSGGEDGVPKINVDATEHSPYSIINWVEPLSTLTLQPNELQSLPVTINVPSNASPGGYYGVIRFTATPGTLKSSGVALSASIGALVFIRVNGDANESMTISSLETSKDGKTGWFFDSQPIDFIERITNTGNTQEQPVSIINVKDMFGKTIANLTLNADQRNVLPDSTRRFDASLDKTNIGNRILFGYYTAEITATYGTDNSLTTTKTIHFFVFPWKIILLIIIALAAIIGGFRYWLKTHDMRVSGRHRRSSHRRGHSSRRGRR